MNSKQANLNPPADRERLQRARDGDPDALEALLEPYWGTLYRLAYRVMGNADDAEDLAQETVVRILQRLPAFRGEADFGTWVYRIGLNTCLTARRRRRETANLREADNTPDPAPGPEATALSREALGRAREEINRLRPAYREAVLLRLAGDLSYEEIAGILQVSVNTVRLRVSRGMNRLRQRLKPWMDGELRG
ncbi:MAG: RNA polymerase sigma factor [Armatimonadetes bacterium]|nr:RNA polymerase sigma factor [Armatimonadota bacterium]